MPPADAAAGAEMGAGAVGDVRRRLGGAGTTRVGDGPIGAAEADPEGADADGTAGTAGAEFVAVVGVVGAEADWVSAPLPPFPLGRLVSPASTPATGKGTLISR